MYMNAFDQLSKELKRRGCTSEVSHSIASSLTSDYTTMYAQTSKTSSEIVLELCNKFPSLNVPEILRPVMDHARK